MVHHACVQAALAARAGALGVSAAASASSRRTTAVGKRGVCAAGAGTRSREGAFGRILGAAVAESAHRCAGEWPARGRPDPVRQHCMLGGQLSLEVASLPATTGMRQPLTASCAAPVGWDNTANHGAGGAAKCEVVAAGYANGAVELLVNSAQGACLATRLPPTGMHLHVWPGFAA